MVSFFLLSFCVLLFSITAFLHVFVINLTFNQLGGFDHSVFDTSVQLTEGRSARDQPKQLPAKKMTQLDLGVNQFCLHCVNLLNVFAIKLKKLGSPSFHLFR